MANPIEFQQQSETAMLKDVILRLSMSIDSMRMASTQMGMNAQMDPVLNRLTQQYGTEDPRLQRDYTQARTSMQEQMLAPILQNMQLTNMKLAELTQQNSQLQQQKMTYGMQDAMPAATSASVPFYAQAAGGLRASYKPVMDIFATNPGYMQEYYRGVQGQDRIMDRGVTGFSNYGGLQLGATAMGGFDLMYQNKLARDANSFFSRPSAFKEYYEYQNDMNRRTQEAALNYTVSQTLGVRSGIINKSEFSQGYTPAIQNFADTLGTTFDEALKVLSKMKDLKAVSADIKSGLAGDISLGVDEAIKSLGAISRLIGSSDLRQLIDTSRSISGFGAGSFKVGMQNIVSSIGQISDTEFSSKLLQQYSGAFNQASNPYIGMLGSNRAGLGMGMAMGRVGKDVGSYGDYYSTAFQRLGGAENITATLGQAYTGNLMSVQALLASSGKGDYIMGGNALTSEMALNPSEFYMGLQDRAYKMREEYSGDRAMMLMDKQVDDLVKKYGLSRREALLAITGGNTNAVAAYKEFEKAGEGVVEEYRSRFKYANAFADNRAAVRVRELNNPYGSSVDATAEAWSRSAFDDMAGGTLFRGLGSMASRFGTNMYESGIIPFEGSRRYYLGSSYETYGVNGQQRQAVEQKMVGRKDFDPMQSGFFDAKGRRIVLDTSQSDVTPGILTSNQASDDVALGIITDALLGTDAGQDAVADEYRKMLENDERPQLAHVQRAIQRSLQEYQQKANVSPDVMIRAHKIAGKATLDDLAKNLLPKLPKDAPIYILIQAARGFKMDMNSMLKSPRDQMTGFMQNMGRSLGMTSEQIRAAGWTSDSAAESLRRGAKWMDRNSTALGVAAGVATAVGGYLAPVSFGTSAVVGLAVEGAVAFAPEVLTGLSRTAEYFGAVTGAGISQSALLEFTDMDAPQIKKEVIGLATALNNIFSTTLGQVGDREGAISKMINLGIDVYKSAHTKELEAKRRGNKNIQSKDVLVSEGSLRTAVDALAKALQPNFGSGTRGSEELSKKAATLILSTLNSSGSELGKQARGLTLNDLSSLKADVSDGVKEASDAGYLGSIFNKLDEFAASMQSIQDLDKTGEKTAQQVLALSTYANANLASRDFEMMKNQVTRTLTSKGKEKDVDAATAIIQNLDAFIKDTTGKEQLSITTEQIKAISEYDKNLGERLDALRTSGKDIKQKRTDAAYFLRELHSGTSAKTEAAATLAQKYIGILYSMANTIVQDQTQEAQNLKKLLAGEA